MTPTEVNGKALAIALDKLAVACLIASVWTEGTRHNLALAIPAFMLKTGVEPTMVQEIVGAVVEEYDDAAEVDDRMKAIRDTIEKFEVGGADTINGARHLNEILRIQLPEPTIFRNDHFLSNELVHRVIVLRFLNRVFDPAVRLWAKLL